MTDHESFVLLAAKQLGEPLSVPEEASLAAHLRACATCRSTAAGLRRDDVRVRAALAATPVSPRVRRRVLEEAAQRRHIDTRLVLVLAAVLVLGLIGVPIMAGRPPDSNPPPTVSVPSPAAADRRTASPDPSVGAASAEPVESRSPLQWQSYVAGAYVYGTSPPRRDTVAAQFDGGPVGEWSRRVPASGEGTTFQGSVTCLVIEGSDAWLAGPVTSASDGSTGGAAMLHLHDGGPDGRGDEVVLWLATEGQTLTTMTSWCENRFIPAGPFPLASGDVVVSDARRE